MMNWKIISIVLLLHLSYVEAKVIKGDGTFLIYGIFPMRNYENKVNYQSGIMMSEAMKYAIQQINSDNSDNSSLHGYKLRIAHIHEYPNDLVRDRVLRTFLNKIPFIIGPYSSELSFVSSILTATFQLVTISYAATYTDFVKFGPTPEGYMVRTVPSDFFRIDATFDLLKVLGWNYIGIISSYGYDGERDAKRFASQLSSIDICLSNQIDLPNAAGYINYLDAVNTLANDERLKAVVMFTTNEDSRKILQAIKKNKLTNRFFLLCMYGCANYLEVIEGLEDVANGVLSINIQSPEVKGFKKYFLKLKPTVDSSNDFIEFWDNLFNCSFKDKTCTGEEELSEGHGYYPLTPVHTVINAVSGLTDALAYVINKICDENNTWMKGKNWCSISPGNTMMYEENVYSVLHQSLDFTSDQGTLRQSGLLLPEEDYTVRYDIHNFILKNGTHQHVHVATWVFNRIGYADNGNLTFYNDWQLGNGTQTKNDAVCSEACPAGHIRERDSSVLKEKCCWQCKQCSTNSIAVNDTCVQCAETEMAEVETNLCVPLPVKFNQLKGNSVAVIFTMASIVGLCFITIVVGFFVKYNHYRMVRASGRDLCYMIFFGISLLFLCPFLFLGKPSMSSCLLRSALPGVGFLSCYAPLFLKTNRIYRIFCHAKKSISRPSMVSSRSLLLVSFGIVAVQILLVGVWFVSKVPVPEAAISKNKEYVTMHCRNDSSPILLLLNVALSVMFMISCTVLAFKTRHFPKNYNEAKYIGITLYITCVAWAVFLPAYFMIPESDFIREYFISGICILIGYITLFGLFGQKIRLLMWQQNLDNGTANLPKWYPSGIDSTENGDVMMARPVENGNSDNNANNNDNNANTNI